MQPVPGAAAALSQQQMPVRGAGGLRDGAGHAGPEIVRVDRGFALRCTRLPHALPAGIVPLPAAAGIIGKPLP